MEKLLTELVFILDRSGSMSHLVADTIGGFNSVIERQKSAEGDAIVTTILFDDRYEKLHDRVALNKINPITEKEYYVHGMTALLDAIGTTINAIYYEQNAMAPAERPQKTVVVIITDGCENSSKEFNGAQVRNLISTRQEKDHWEFIFMGANIDTVNTAKEIGIDATHAVNYHATSSGSEAMYDSVSAYMSESRCCKCCAPQSTDWRKRVDDEFNGNDGSDDSDS